MAESSELLFTYTHTYLHTYTHPAVLMSFILFSTNNMKCYSEEGLDEFLPNKMWYLLRSIISSHLFRHFIWSNSKNTNSQTFENIKKCVMYISYFLGAPSLSNCWIIHLSIIFTPQPEPLPNSHTHVSHKSKYSEFCFVL